ncbi:ABC transporter permease [uncultured Enterovirga sp.]|uniref:ABC transporter permease n=1 Tax=uncultured Enterovirga sp. TaxID=2026352 RepID=UPI0035CA43E2
MRAWLNGRWTVEHAGAVEREMAGLVEATVDCNRILIDLSGIERLDTLGAWVLDRTRHEFGGDGLAADFVNARSEHHILLNEVAYRGFQPEVVAKPPGFMDLMADIGGAVAGAGKDFVRGVSFLGELVSALIRVIVNPKRFRVPALTNQLEQIAFRGVPIIVLICFLVGCIVAQQGLFQLQRFGAQTFVVNLVGILVLRELGVLLTSIMVAGRSGAAFTAEIGSMKMREEIDALRVMGLDPVEVLIVPRILALVIGLPILAFLGSMAALIGAGLVSWIYGDIVPDVFLARLKSTIDVKTFMVGLIKAPFMALVIGVIASIEGLAVEGSAESLGRHVTSSVVKAIFMVIVLDGFFAIFFAAIKF